MDKAHIITGPSAVWIRTRLASTARTLCGITDYQGSDTADLPICVFCERLAGWGKPQAHKVPSGKAPSPNALNAVASQAATDHGYLLAPLGIEVCRRLDRTSVERVPVWEAEALHHLIRNKHVTRGGLVVVTHCRKQRHMYEVETKR